MRFTIFIGIVIVLLLLVLIVLQAKALSKCEMTCVFCGTTLHFSWKRLLFRQHVANDWWLECPVCGRKTWFTAKREAKTR